MSVEKAIEIYTINVARAIGHETHTGSVEVGKSADFAILNQNLFEIAPTESSKTKVLQTWFNGRLVHEA